MHSAVNFNLVKSTMYHGTHSGNYVSLYKGINTRQNNRKLDFGTGFYLTSDFDQASNHARNKARNGGFTPIVFVYNIDIQKLKSEYVGYIHKKLDETWAEFIFTNRSKKFYNAHSYDYVYGGVADGYLFDLVNEMDNSSKKPDFSVFLNNIAKYLYDQLSINSQRIVSDGIIDSVKVVYADDQTKKYVPA